MSNFPVALVRADGSFAVYYGAEPFVGPGGDRHPVEAWSLWSAEDWEARCPGWSPLPLVDVPPAEAGKRAERRPEAEWTVGADAVTVAYGLVDLSGAELEAALEAARVAKVQAINAERDRRLAMGAPYAGRRVEVSDRGRADLGGMVSAAMLASNGLTPWGEGYARGWIAMDNERIPLPTPADGIQLAAAVGDWYGLVMQHARDLKDQAEAGNPADVDELAGWPGDEAPVEAAA
jgi:hypothetical protein